MRGRYGTKQTGICPGFHLEAFQIALDERNPTSNFKKKPRTQVIFRITNNRSKYFMCKSQWLWNGRWLFHPNLSIFRACEWVLYDGNSISSLGENNFWKNDSFPKSKRTFARYGTSHASYSTLQAFAGTLAFLKHLCVFAEFLYCEFLNEQWLLAIQKIVIKEIELRSLTVKHQLVVPIKVIQIFTYLRVHCFIAFRSHSNMERKPNSFRMRLTFNRAIARLRENTLKIFKDQTLKICRRMRMK